MVACHVRVHVADCGLGAFGTHDCSPPSCQTHLLGGLLKLSLWVAEPAAMAKLAPLAPIMRKIELKLKDLLGEAHICEYIQLAYPGKVEKKMLAHKMLELLPLRYNQDPGPPCYAMQVRHWVCNSMVLSKWHASVVTILQGCACWSMPRHEAAHRPLRFELRAGYQRLACWIYPCPTCQLPLQT